MFCRVEECGIRPVRPRCGGSKVALLADDRRVAPLCFVEACLVDLKPIRLICDVGLGFARVTYIPTDLAGAPFDLGEDFWVALHCSALVERKIWESISRSTRLEYVGYHQLTSLCL